MAKTHAYSRFNGWHILSSLVLFVDSWYSKVIEIKLMNYFSLEPKNSKLERNEAFSAEIILYFIRNKGNYLTFLDSDSSGGARCCNRKRFVKHTLFT